MFNQVGWFGFKERWRISITVHWNVAGFETNWKQTKYFTRCWFSWFGLRGHQERVRDEDQGLPVARGRQHVRIEISEENKKQWIASFGRDIVLLMFSYNCTRNVKTQLHAHFWNRIMLLMLQSNWNRNVQWLANFW